MKKYSVWNKVLVAGALFFSACSTDTVNEADGGMEVQRLIISADDFIDDESSLSSRTNVDPSRGFSWAANDTIGIFPERGDQLPFAMASGEGTDVATITGGSWGLKTSEEYAAYYPFSRQNYFTDRGNIYFSYVGQVQTADNSTAHLGAFDLMAADNAESNGSSLNFHFTHLSCIVKLKITVPYAGAYSSLTLNADEDVFATKVKLNLEESPSQLSEVEKSKSVSLGLTDFTTPSDNYLAIAYMMCSPFNLANKSITLKLKSANGYTYSCTKTLSKAYVASMLYTINFSSLTKDNTPSIGIGGEFETSDEEM